MGAVRTRLELPAGLREIAICVVATINRAPYEFHHHAPLLRAAGASQAQVDALADVDRALATPGLFDSAERATIQLALEMTRSVAGRRRRPSRRRAARSATIASWSS